MNRHLFPTFLYYLAKDSTDIRYLSGNDILLHIISKKAWFFEKWFQKMYVSFFAETFVRNICCKKKLATHYNKFIRV